MHLSMVDKLNSKFSLLFKSSVELNPLGVLWMITSPDVHEVFEDSLKIICSTIFKIIHITAYNLYKHCSNCSNKCF